MISVDEAKKIIAENINILPPVEQSLQDSAGLTLAQDVVALNDIPAFNQSSMDGYAFLFDDWEQYKKLDLAGEIQAGNPNVITLLPRQAIRIFTGAPLPLGADTVVMQEKVNIEKEQLLISDEKIRKGSNMRLKGSEIKAGSIALEKGSVLNPAAIGFLAGIGINRVSVFPKPSISVIVTGKELQAPGKELLYGQVYESNSFALEAALNQLHFTAIQIHRCDDELELLIKVLKEALEKSDVVLLTGGISVGDYDFVLEAAMQCGVEKLFHKVKQKPGKPLYAGKKGNKPVFGLPGNPSSVLSCFYQYVVPALYKMSTQNNPVKTIEVVLSCDYQKPAGLTHFLKGHYNGKTVAALDAQESYKMSSFARANCLIRVDEEITECYPGEKIQIYLLPA